MRNIIRKCDCAKIGSAMSINGIKYVVTNVVISGDKKSVTYTVDNFDFYNRFGQPRVRHMVKTVDQIDAAVKTAV